MFSGYTIKTAAMGLALLLLLTSGSPVALAEEAPSPKPDTAASPRPSDNGKVSFNFIDVEITKIAEFVSDLTGKNFIFDERVRGKITIVAPSRLKKGEAYNLFTSVLQLKGFALVPSGVNAFKIVPAAEVKQSGLDVSTRRRPVNEDYIVRLIVLEHISAAEALKFLQPLITRSGYISSFGPGNMVMVIDSGVNLKKLLRIVSTIDKPSHHEEPEVIYLKNSAAETMANMLNQGVAKSKIARKGAPARTAARAVADKRLNSVVLFGSKAEKDAMKRLLALLDVPSEEEQGSINVYFLENADADEMAKVLQGMVGAAKKTGRKAPKRPGAPAAPGGGVSPFQSASGLTITPDIATNALVIIGSPSDYASLVSIIKQLDRRRKQVYVEAMIVEASLDKLKEMGSKWRGAASHNNDPVVIGGVGTMDATSMQEILSGMAGMSVGGMTNYLDVDVVGISSTGTPTTQTLTIPGFAALFSLSEFNGVVDILSSPQIMTADNTEAEIVVGENVPFVTKTETTTSTNPIKSIERKNVGISLKLTPQITEGDYVKLDLYQEISSVKESSEKIITEVGPTTSTRSTRTSIIVKDKQTVVISGLMEDREVKGETRVPLLHRIPILGWLFKYRTRSKVKTNLLVFITPHIIRDDEEMAEMTAAKSTAYAQLESQYAPGELLVKFRDGVGEEKAQDIISREKASIIKKLQDGLFHVSLNRKMKVKKGVKEFMDYSEVEYAEPNFTMEALESLHGMRRSSADILGSEGKIRATTEENSPKQPAKVIKPLAPPSWIENDIEEEPPQQEEPIFEIDENLPAEGTEADVPQGDILISPDPDDTRTDQ
jgi:general secretion pathway protein D